MVISFTIIVCVFDPDVDKNLKLVRLCLHLACVRDEVHTLDIPNNIMFKLYYRIYLPEKKGWQRDVCF